ncbi:hypothetical protein [Rufibacter hautae]|uniref:Lipoprotein n=1 Tax=Rufibacter hautae TaxID=2595005 RepID=A0A5B6TK31_9BACT|nr:hypothetical protein [Rufibacter hautae]KAA3439759.1 hypothetical protein FOA19_03520 [Rufibacter hautae]
MKLLKHALPLAALLLLSCGPNERGENITTREEAQASNIQSEEQSQQADVLTKDTLNVVQDEVVKKPTLGTSSDFEPFFENFRQTITQQDAGEFNQWIDPDLGLYLIETPGAVPHFTHVTDIKEFQLAGADGQTFFSIRDTFTECSPEEVKILPTITCQGEDNNFTRQGCFVAEATAFRKSEAYKYAGLSPKEEQKVLQTQLLVSKTVLHTNSGFRFHFGQINGQWRVLFIDLSVPCSA